MSRHETRIEVTDAAGVHYRFRLDKITRAEVVDQSAGGTTNTGSARR